MGLPDLDIQMQPTPRWMPGGARLMWRRWASPREIKALKESTERKDDAPPVIRKIHKKGTAADPLRGLFETKISGKPAVVEYEPDSDLRDTEQVPLLEAGGIGAFTERNERVRIITARVATRRERKAYEKNTNKPEGQ